LKKWLLAVLCLSLVGAARAHQPGLSTLVVQLQSNSFAADLIVAWPDVHGIVPVDLDQNREWSDVEFAATRARLLVLASNAVALEADGKELEFTGVDVRREDVTGVHFAFTGPFPGTTAVLLVRSEILAELPRGHHEIVTVRGQTNQTLAEYAMTRDRNIIEVPLAEGAAAEVKNDSVWHFLWLGVEHILAGWDHLTFLLGLLVVGARGKEALKIITAFTVAHSLTLALATFDLVRIPSSIVEGTIAASIIYVGVENMVRHEYRGRWALTFAFGLIHGCGFATALRDLGVGAGGSSVVKPLLCFNLGVEAGQLAIAAAVLPWIWKLKPKFGRRWVVGTSVVVVLLGAYFLLQRLGVLPGG
jgi:hydrogenase/urease accessory protein HupE